MVEELAGEIAGSPYDTFEEAESKIWASTYRQHLGGLPVDIIASEPHAGAAYSTIIEYDGLGRLISRRDAGVYLTMTKYDEAGNVRELHAPGFDEPERADHDSRGLPLVRTLPDGSTQHFQYDALGNLTRRTDEDGQATLYEYGGLGRTERVRYPDGTFEQTRYEPETDVPQARRDRAGHWIAYAYDAGGRVAGVHGGETTSAALLVRVDHDAGGRLALIRNADAGVGYAEYDLLGRPGVRRTYRYRDGIGLDTAPLILDVHTQRHVWSTTRESEARGGCRRPARRRRRATVQRRGCRRSTKNATRRATSSRSRGRSGC